MTAAELKETPLHALHVALGARMVPFAGYDMPVQYPTGILTEHLHTRAQAGLFDVSHMGQAWPHRAGRRAALETLVPGDIAGPGAGPPALHPLHQRRGRHPRRSDGDARSAITLFVVVNAGCKHAGFRAPRRRSCPGGSARRFRSSTAPCWRCRDRRRRPSLAAPRTRASPAMGFMTGREVAVDGVDAASSRARATPARTATRSRSRRARARVAQRKAAGRAGGEADRPRRARLAAARSRALPLRPRHRHDDDADRGRPQLGRSASAGAPRAAFPGAARRQADQLAEAPAPARRHPARGAAPAREGTDPDRCGRPPSASRHFGRLRAELRRAGRHGLCRDRPRQPTAPRCTLIVRGKPLPADRRRRCLSSPHRYFQGGAP
jgi:aminomethyltransferase